MRDFLGPTVRTDELPTLACVASVSVWFRSKERPRNGILMPQFMKQVPKNKNAIFRAVFDSRSSFFAPKPHGNACYAGYTYTVPISPV